MPIRHSRRRITVQRHESAAGKLLALSLFIMLLAFFIVLTALSSYEETRVVPIFQSLEMAFASTVRNESENKAAVSGRSTLSTGEGTTLERLEALFRSIIPGRQVVRNSRTGTLHVNMDIETFERAITMLSLEQDLEGVREEARETFILPALVALLQAGQQGAPYHMDVLLEVGENPAQLMNSTPDKTMLDMKRVGVFVQRIEDAGLPAKYVSAGLQKGQRGMVELFFRPYVPFSPLPANGAAGDAGAGGAQP